MKRKGAKDEKTVEVGRLLEILEEQAKPTFSVCIAGGIDAVFSVTALAAILIILGSLAVSQPHLLYLVLQAIELCQVFSHAVVYGIRDNDIRKKIVEVYNNIRGPKKSKVITLNGQ